jgi:hypothetical protein
MERGVVLGILLSVSGSALSNQIIFEHGKNSGSNFNGWKIEPYRCFTYIQFTEESVSFFVENGGDYSLELSRKVEHLRRYSKYNLQLEFTELTNCQLNGISFYISEDEKNWKPVEMDGDFIHDEALEFYTTGYVKIVADLSFQKEGYVECSYIKLKGEEPLEILDPSELKEEKEKEFFIFCFNKSINVETKNEDPFQVVFTNLAGQVVYQHSALGSLRMEPELPEGIYVVSIIQNNQIIENKKVVL